MKVKRGLIFYLFVLSTFSLFQRGRLLRIFPNIKPSSSCLFLPPSLRRSQLRKAQRHSDGCFFRLWAFHCEQPVFIGELQALAELLDRRLNLQQPVQTPVVSYLRVLVWIESVLKGFFKPPSSFLVTAVRKVDSCALCRFFLCLVFCKSSGLID